MNGNRIGTMPCGRRRSRLAAPVAVLAALVVMISFAGCGSSGGSTGSTARAATSTARGSVTTAPQRSAARTLHAAQRFALPAPRSGGAGAVFGADIFLIGGLSAAGVSTSTVFTLSRRGRASTSGELPVPVHDAAATEISGHLLLFGGGPAEGSDRVVQVLPGSPRLIGKLPQSLSDLDAASIDGVAYVVGGFNGSFPIRDIYAAGTNGTVTRAGTLPLGVRYPAVAALGGRVVVAGGETASGGPTSDVWSFDPATSSVQRLPHLPIPTDHAAGATLDGSFYLIAGLRRGVFTNAILSWTPGESRWHDAGHLPAALSDLAAVPFDGGIAVIGGRGSAGSVSTVTVMRAR